MKRFRLVLYSVITLLAGAAVSFGAGYWSNWPIVGGASYCASTAGGICTATIPAGPTAITGNETIPANKNLSGNSPPSNVLLSMASVNLLPYAVFRANNGDSVTISPLTGTVVISPHRGVTALANLTVQAPSSPVDGQTEAVSTNTTVTVFKFSPNTGQTVDNAPSALTVSTTGSYGYKYLFESSTSTWHRLQ